MLRDGLRLADAEKKPPRPRKSFQESHLVEEVDDAGQLAAGTVRVNWGGMLPDEDAAAGLADNESLFSKQADRLLDSHASDAEELGQFVARWELVSAFEFAGEDCGPNRVGNLDERGTRVRWVH